MKRIFLGVCLIFLSCCAISDTKDVKYFARSEENCLFRMCRIGKDQVVSCNRMISTDVMDETSAYIIYHFLNDPNTYLTNGSIILKANESWQCLQSKRDYSSTKTKRLISEKLRESMVKWAQEDEQIEEWMKETKKRLENAEEEGKAKEAEAKEKKRKAKILNSKKIVEAKLADANIKFSDISLIINDLSSQPKKDEFETTAEYEKRVETFKNKKLKKYNNLIFKYNLTTEYDADDKVFYIFVKNDLNVDFKQEKSKYIARNAFNAEALVTRTDTYEKNIIIDTDFSTASEFHKGNSDRKLSTDYLVIKDIPVKKAKTLSKKLDLIVVGKLKDTEISSHTYYRGPKINSPYEWNDNSSSIKIAVSGICVVNRATNKCMIAFEPD